MPVSRANLKFCRVRKGDPHSHEATCTLVLSASFGLLHHVSQETVCFPEVLAMYIFLV